MGVKNGNKEDKFPIISVQCDWDNTLMTPGNEIWASYKYKDCPSVHGKVSCVSSAQGVNKYESTPGFSAKLINQQTLEIELSELKHKAALLAPSSSHTNIHSKSITSFDVTSKGVVVSASSDGKLKVWNSDKEGRKFQLELEGHEGDVYKCKFFPSEKVILSCSNDMSLRIWCAISGQCPVKLIGHSQAVTDFAIIDRGRNILSVSKDGSAKLWNCGDAECLGDVMKVPSPINCCLVQQAPSSLTLDQPNQPPNPKEVGTEGKLLLLGCEDGMVYCGNLRSRSLLFSISCESPVNCLCFISETRFIIGCQNGKVMEYEIHDGKGLAVCSWHDSNSSVLCLLTGIDADHNFFVSRADGSTILRPFAYSSVSLHLTGPNCDPVYHMAANDDFIYTCCRDSVLRVYDRSNLTSLLIE